MPKHEISVPKIANLDCIGPKQYLKTPDARNFLDQKNINDYIKITSYSYLEFNKPGELLVNGNWLHKKDFYNIK